MNTLRAPFIIASIAFINACSFAPLTPRVDAASIGKNEFKIEYNQLPTQSFSVIYGLGEKLDVGFDLEQLLLGTTWARYSFINNPDGFSMATNAAVFIADGENRSNGWYAGLLASSQFNSQIRWTAGLRYAVLDYEYGTDDGGWFSSSIDFDNPDDASHNAQADITMSWLLKPHLELALGMLCQRLLKNKDPQHKDQYCLPTIGFSFYRR